MGAFKHHYKSQRVVDRAKALAYSIIERLFCVPVTSPVIYASPSSITFSYAQFTRCSALS